MGEPALVETLNDIMLMKEIFTVTACGSWHLYQLKSLKKMNIGEI